MDVLLGTHALLWFITGDGRLSTDARQTIEDPGRKKYVSIASIWEVAIKVSIGKLTLTQPFDNVFPHQLHVNGFDLLPISVSDISRVSTLPFYHRDPFDRLLVAQAIASSLIIISGDAAFEQYGISRIW